jgi:hypothetical protein
MLAMDLLSVCTAIILTCRSVAYAPNRFESHDEWKFVGPCSSCLGLIHVAGATNRSTSSSRFERTCFLRSAGLLILSLRSTPLSNPQPSLARRALLQRAPRVPGVALVPKFRR